MKEVEPTCFLKRLFITVYTKVIHVKAISINMHATSFASSMPYTCSCLPSCFLVEIPPAGPYMSLETIFHVHYCVKRDEKR